MTEKQLRQQVVDIINGWVGAVRGDSRHAEILHIYNSYKPLARGYTVQTKDAYCATTASAAYIKAGIAAYTGTECGVGQWIDIAKGKGIWIESDSYVPKLGDAICYDWDDSGSGDNLGYPDHVGIVTAVNGNSFTVTEGNINGGQVGKRNMQVNGRYIRGFIAPNYATIAAVSGEEETQKPVTPAAPQTCKIELPVLRYGSNGGHVKTLQILLNSYNKAGLGIDGVFGAVTEKAVKAYQRSRNLGVDGVVGALTWAMLLK